MTTNSKKKPAAKNPYKEVAERVTLDELDALLPAAPPGTSALIFGATQEADLLERGQRVDTANILADVPGFVGASLNILHALGDRFSAVHLPPAIFRVLLDETKALTAQNQKYDATAGSATAATQGRTTGVRADIKRGVALRDKVLTALGNALGDEATQALSAASSDGSTAQSLATGLTSIAKFLGDRLENGSEREAKALELWLLDETTQADLEALAAKLGGYTDASTHTRAVEQRKLDLQDGRVLHLINIVLRAFKQGHRADATVLVPRLNRLASQLGSRHVATKPAAPPPPAVVPPAK